jgi:hypothetical protein
MIDLAAAQLSNVIHGRIPTASWIATVTSIISLILILSPSRVWSANGVNQSLEIEDVVTTRHLIPVGDLYTDGKNKYLCVQTEDRRYALWNPADGNLSHFSEKKNCEISSDLHNIRFSMVNGLRYCNNLPANCAASFSNGNIYSDSEGGAGGHCVSLLFDAYYRVVYSDGTTNEFYLLRKLLKPREYTLREWCDAANGKAQHVTLNYDVPQISSVDIGNGKTLLFSYGHDDISAPFMLIVSKLPDTVWSSARTVFLIPKRLILPGFPRTGLSLINQYNLFLQEMGESAMPSSDPQKQTH